MSSRLMFASLVAGVLAIGAMAQQPTPAAPKTAPSTPNPSTTEMRIAAIEELATKLLKETQALKAELKAAKKPAESSGDFRIIRLRFAEASQMAKIVSAAMETGDEKTIRVIADPATNSLLVRAAPEQLKAIEVILMHLDVEGSGESPTRLEFGIFELRHAEAVDMAKLLKELLPKKAISSMRIVADHRTNSILVHAAPDEINFVKAMIFRLDEHAAASKKVPATTPVPLPK